MKSRTTAIAVALGTAAAMGTGIYLLAVKNDNKLPSSEQMESSGTVNPDREVRRMTTERMPVFSERALSLPPSSAVGSYTPSVPAKSASETKPTLR